MCKPLDQDDLCALCLDYSMAHCKDCEYRERVKGMTDVQKALLGDREAAKRITYEGVMLPCPFCGGDADVVAYTPRLLRPSRNHTYCISCNDCEMLFGWDIDYGGRYDTEYEAMLTWNTRAPILSAEEMEMLNGKENP